MIIFSGDFIANKTALCEKTGGHSSNQANKRPAAKAGPSVFPEILAEILLLRDISFNIHVEIADEIEVNMLFHQSLPSTRFLLDVSPETKEFEQIRVSATQSRA